MRTRAEHIHNNTQQHVLFQSLTGTACARASRVRRRGAARCVAGGANPLRAFERGSGPLERNVRAAPCLHARSACRAVPLRAFPCHSPRRAAPRRGSGAVPSRLASPLTQQQQPARQSSRILSDSRAIRGVSASSLHCIALHCGIARALHSHCRAEPSRAAGQRSGAQPAAQLIASAQCTCRAAPRRADAYNTFVTECT